MSSNHKWRFFRAGGFDQVQLASGSDVAALDQLDQKLWAALACPTTGLDFDAKTLALLDTDKDGRIRVPEVLAAVKWTLSCLKNPDDLLKGSSSLPLEAINDGTPEGKQLRDSARQILANLKKGEARAISLEDTTDTSRIFAQTNFNGDGIVPVESAENEAVRAVIQDIIACLGPEMDRSGRPGINQAKADHFFAEAQAYSDWWAKSETDPATRPLNGATEKAAAAFKAVKAKIDDYFTRCRVAAFDPRAVNALNREEKEYLSVAAKDLTASTAEIASLPLAQVGPGKPLPLREGVNPAWTHTLDQFETEVVRPLFPGKTSLTESDWAAISGKFAAFEAWAGAKAGTTVEKLGLKRIREILAGPAKGEISRLIAKDKALEPEANAIASVDKLVRFHAYLHAFLNNFVNFRDFYDPKTLAVFQAGTLYLDQRACQLCLAVEDAAKHASLAALAGAYLAYCDCTRKSTGEKRQIVAAFTGGDSDNLMVGRNGLFYDRQGRDWDATIVKIVDNPISIRQAFWAPYKKLVRMIEEQVAKRAAASDAAVTDKMAATASQVATVDKPAAAPEAKAGPKKIDVGVVAALGVAVGAIGGALATLATGIMKLAVWQIPLVVVAAILLISLPSMVIAWLKLRKRNLGPLLDANGWAVNSRGRINLPFGESLTQLASLPAGAERDLVDPYAEKRRPWGFYIFLVILVGLGICWYLGKLDANLPGKVRSTTVLGTNAPAYKAPQ